MCTPCCWDESSVFILSMHYFPKEMQPVWVNKLDLPWSRSACWGLKENVSRLRQ